MEVKTIEFLSAFRKEEEMAYIRSFDDTKKTKNSKNFSAKLSNFNNLEAELVEWNNGGNGIFFVVNAGGQKSDKIERITAHFVDFDNGTEDEQKTRLSSFPLKPSIIVKTVRGYHVYWLISEGNIKNFKAIQEGLNSFLGTDEQIKDLSRVMRLPNFYHHKGIPFLVECEVFNPKIKYTEAEFETALLNVSHTLNISYGITEKETKIPITFFEGNRNTTLTSIAGTMRKKGMSADAINKALITINSTQCKPPLSLIEIKTISNSVGGYATAIKEFTPFIIEKLTKEQFNEQSIYEQMQNLDGIVAAQFENNLREKAKNVGALKTFETMLKAYKAQQKETKSTEPSANSTYFIENGCVFRQSGERVILISNFNAKPIEDITKDDGMNTIRFFTVNGTLASGETLPAVTVSANDFTNMNYVTKCWDLRARIQPNQKEYLRDYIQSQADNIIKRTIFTHTGFREYEGKLCYLYNGGVVGNISNVECELDTALSKFAFNQEIISEKEAFLSVMELFHIAPKSVSYPMLAFYLLAPLNYFLSKAGFIPSFALYSVGASGSFKTTLNILYCAMFKNYSPADSSTANFSDTANAIEKRAFSLKDSIILVDDFHPQNAYEMQKMTAIAQRLARGAGDHAGRSRLNADTSLKISFPPRGLSAITGEDVPDIGISGLARYFIIRFENREIIPSELSKVQEQGKQINAFMKQFILWQIENAKSLPEKLKIIFLKFRDSIKIPLAHTRLPSNIAWLMSAIITFCDYACDKCLMSKQDADDFKTKAFETFNEIGLSEENYWNCVNSFLEQGLYK